MRKTHKLLAVMMWIGSAQAQADTPRTLRTGSPACGNTMSKKASKAEVPERTELQLAEEQVEFTERAEHEYVQRFVTTPRRLASGAPACGNTMGKGPAAPCTEEVADREQAERFSDLQAALRSTRAARERLRAAREITALAGARNPTTRSAR